MSNIFLPSVTNGASVPKVKEHIITPYEAQKNFAAYLKQSIEKVNQLQVESDHLTEKLVSGKDVDLHEVMIASQKASITMQLTLELRNKAIEAYQEIMRMQV